MAAMDGFDHILNWKLKEGSHPFPGKDGGTCINEAALVAAGFEYRPVRRVEDMPEPNRGYRSARTLAFSSTRRGRRRAVYNVSSRDNHLRRFAGGVGSFGRVRRGSASTRAT